MGNTFLESKNSDIIGVGAKAKGAFLNWIIKLIGTTLPQKIKNLIKGQESGFWIRMNGGDLDSRSFFGLHAERFVLGQGTELQQIMDELIIRLDNPETGIPGLSELYIRIHGNDRAAIIKQYAFLDSYLYNAKIASLDLYGDGHYILPLDLSDPNEPRLMLETLRLTTATRAGRSGNYRNNCWGLS